MGVNGRAMALERFDEQASICHRSKRNTGGCSLRNAGSRRAPTRKQYDDFKHKPQVSRIASPPSPLAHATNSSGAASGRQFFAELWSGDATRRASAASNRKAIVRCLSGCRCTLFSCAGFGSARADRSPGHRRTDHFLQQRPGLHGRPS